MVRLFLLPVSYFLIFQGTHHETDLVRIEAPTRKKGIQSSSPRKIIELRERFPLLRGNAVDGRGGIDAIAVLQLLNRPIGDLARDAFARQFLPDAHAGRPRPEDLGASKSSRKVSVIEELLLQQPSDHLADLGGRFSFLEQPAPQLGNGAGAKAEQPERRVVRLEVHRDPFSAA